MYNTRIRTDRYYTIVQETQMLWRNNSIFKKDRLYVILICRKSFIIEILRIRIRNM